MSVFENNGWGVTVNVGPFSYTYYEMTFANGETYSYYVPGGGAGGGVWVSLIGCNDCTPESLEGFFGDFDLTLILGMGVSSDGNTTVFSANLGLGGSFGGSYTIRNPQSDVIADFLQGLKSDLDKMDGLRGLGDIILNERDDDPNSGWPDDNELTAANDNRKIYLNKKVA